MTNIGIIGVPFDEGVTASNGRPGAKEGPKAIRQALKRYSLDIEDLGDVDPDKVTEAVRMALERNTLPIVIGGGHDITFSTIKALTQFFERKVGGINVDSHLDVREVKNGVITSGTPFRRALEELDGKFDGNLFIELGTDKLVNSQEHIDYVKAKGAQIIAVDEFHDQNLFSELGDNAFISIDIDSIQQTFAPGCSAPAPFGFNPEEVRKIAFEAGKSPNIKLFDLMELNPLYDIDGRTARLAAGLICAFVEGYNKRTPQVPCHPELVSGSTPLDSGSEAGMTGGKHSLYLEEKPAGEIRAQTGTELRCQTWETEAALRMLENNLDPKVALVPDELIVYGGSGRAARNWRCFNTIVRSLKNLKPDETILVQSGKAVGVLKTFEHCPRVLIANANLVPAWSTQGHFDKYDAMGLTMYGQMTAGSWIYIGTQGIIQGTYETFAAMADQHFGGSLAGKLVVSGGMGGMSGAQPLAITMNSGVALIVEILKERIEQKVREGYCDKIAYNLDEALKLTTEAIANKQPLSVGLVGNTADIIPKLVRRDIIPNIITDQTSAHDLSTYVPYGNMSAQESIVKHTEAILEMQKRGAIAVDYGNNIRGQAEKGGLQVRNEKGEFLYPGFVPAYIRPLFCEGKGPFRWAALSGDPEDIRKIDKKILETFPEDRALARWIKLAQEKIPFIGLPTRVCWLGYGDRAKMGLIINEMVATGELKAPIVIGRDHLDCGSVASPNRETEAMKDGSDAIADWPLLNALANTACGADWISIHNGGGVGIGNATHAGMVVVATGTKQKAKRLERVLTSDPGLGIMRHVDASYEKAIEIAKKKNVQIPRLN